LGKYHRFSHKPKYIIMRNRLLPTIVIINQQLSKKTQNNILTIKKHNQAKTIKDNSIRSFKIKGYSISIKDNKA
jgi:hypothetical protein